MIIKNNLNYYRYRLTKKFKILFTNLMCIYLNFFVILKNDKNLFIDLGTNLGQGFNFFSKHFRSSKFDYLLVEANPNLKSHLSKLINKIGKDKIQLINKAAFVHNGKINLYGLVEDHRGKISDGASIIKDHASLLYDANEENGSLNIYPGTHKILGNPNFELIKGGGHWFFQTQSEYINKKIYHFLN